MATECVWLALGVFFATVVDLLPRSSPISAPLAHPTYRLFSNMKPPGSLKGFLALLLVHISVVIAYFPPNMPQVCYTGKNKLAPSYLMPCLTDPVDDGNVYGCCVVGDYCLANQACFSPVKGMIYHKGCTKKDYDDGHCPLKCHADQTKSDWVGLIFCNGTNNTPKDTWVSNYTS